MRIRLVSVAAACVFMACPALSAELAKSATHGPQSPLAANVAHAGASAPVWRDYEAPALEWSQYYGRPHAGSAPRTPSNGG